VSPWLNGGLLGTCHVCASDGRGVAVDLCCSHKHPLCCRFWLDPFQVLAVASGLIHGNLLCLTDSSDWQVLALELLKILLENSGPVFATSEKFAAAIKQYLCLSLLKNCASAISQALRLSCSIFLTLISKFRQSLKAEIGVFFPMILLRSIEPQPAGSSPQQPSALTIVSSNLPAQHLCRGNNESGTAAQHLRGYLLQVRDNMANPKRLLTMSAK